RKQAASSLRLPSPCVRPCTSPLFLSAAPVSRPRGQVPRSRTVGGCDRPVCPARSTTAPCGSAGATIASSRCRSLLCLRPRCLDEALVPKILVPHTGERRQVVHQMGAHHQLPRLVHEYGFLEEAEVVLLEGHGLEQASRIHLEHHLRV